MKAFVVHKVLASSGAQRASPKPPSGGCRASSTLLVSYALPTPKNESGEIVGCATPLLVSDKTKKHGVTPC